MSQTTVKNYVFAADGAKVSVMADGEVAYTDIGQIKDDVGVKTSWTELFELTGNAGWTDYRAKNAEAELTFVLQNLDMDNITRMSSGLITSSISASAPISTIPNQLIAANWDDYTTYELVMETSSTDATLIKPNAKPTLTSVTLDAGGTPEVLAENTEYVITELPTAVSGYGIQFISANMSTGTPKTKAITIDYGTNTPIGRTTYYIGQTVATLASFAMQLTHTDAAGLVRGMTLPRCYIKPGSIDFTFKGANKDEFEEMTITIRAILDDTLTAGQQLMSIFRDTGAQ